MTAKIKAAVDTVRAPKIPVDVPGKVVFTTIQPLLRLFEGGSLMAAWARLFGAATGLVILSMSSGAQAATCVVVDGGSCSYGFTDPGSIAVSVPFGSVQVSENAAGTKLNFKVSVAPNFSIDTGSHEAFSFGIGNNQGVPISTANLASFGSISNIVGTGPSTLSAFIGNPGSNSPFGDFNYALACSATGGSSNCGNHFSFDFNFANANSGKLIPSTGDANIWFAADICVNVNGVCSGTTGAVGAAAVPGPIVGAGLPGFIAACGGLLMLGRRRRNGIT